jgi:hypothetical protein
MGRPDGLLRNPQYLCSLRGIDLCPLGLRGRGLLAGGVSGAPIEGWDYPLTKGNAAIEWNLGQAG